MIDWFPRIVASEYIHSVKPWEWDNVPLVWLKWTIAAREIMIQVQNAQAREQNSGTPS